jgi:hypothetical protein
LSCDQTEGLHYRCREDGPRSRSNLPRMPATNGDKKSANKNQPKPKRPLRSAATPERSTRSFSALSPSSPRSLPSVVVVRATIGATIDPPRRHPSPPIRHVAGCEPASQLHRSGFITLWQRLRGPLLPHSTRGEHGSATFTSPGDMEGASGARCRRGNFARIAGPSLHSAHRKEEPSRPIIGSY